MRVLASVIAVLLVCHGIDAQKPPTRAGIVGGDMHVFVDDNGPFLARGASLFWALWGYEHDRERLGRNLATLRDWGFDYIRVLGVVGAPGDRPGPTCASGVEDCDTWRDRRLDPGSANYERNIADLTDWAYREYGLRVQWTIFGGIEFTPTPESRRVLVQRFASMSKGREASIFAFEIANEAFQNGFDGESGRQELIALAKLLKSETRNLVALSSPHRSECTAAQQLYHDSPADLLTLHVARGREKDGENWKVLRDMWEMQSCTGVPQLVSSNEPIGPQSSGVSLDDPLALTAMALVMYVSGMGAVVFHSGPGVRGGGQADLALGRPGNLWQLPTGSRIAAGLTTIPKLMPGDLPNWSKHDAMSADPERVFDVADKRALAGLYCAHKDSAFACAAVGLTKAVGLSARKKMSVTIYELVDGKAEPTRHLAAGDSLELSASPPAMLIRGELQ